MTGKGTDCPCPGGCGECRREASCPCPYPPGSPLEAGPNLLLQESSVASGSQFPPKALMTQPWCPHLVPGLLASRRAAPLVWECPDPPLPRKLWITAHQFPVSWLPPPTCPPGDSCHCQGESEGQPPAQLAPGQATATATPPEDNWL